MEYITSSDFHFKDTAVALGKFEGIHRGHHDFNGRSKKTGASRTAEAYLPDRPAD